MSKHIANMKIGETLDFKGPIVKLPYKPNQYKEIGMVAGGTGIAPMLQVVDEILENKSDKTKVSLIFACVLGAPAQAPRPGTHCAANRRARSPPAPAATSARTTSS